MSRYEQVVRKKYSIIHVVLGVLFEPAQPGSQFPQYLNPIPTDCPIQYPSTCHFFKILFNSMQCKFQYVVHVQEQKNRATATRSP